jgi:hypothetical protein
MLQVFQINVAKADRDIAYVAMVCTCMLQASVPDVSSIAGMCYIWMLHMFRTYVAIIFNWMSHMFAMVLKCFSGVFFQVFQTHVSSVSPMLQMLHLNVSKVD